MVERVALGQSKYQGNRRDAGEHTPPPGGRSDQGEQQRDQPDVEHVLPVVPLTSICVEGNRALPVRGDEPEQVVGQ